MSSWSSFYSNISEDANGVALANQKLVAASKENTMATLKLKYDHEKMAGGKRYVATIDSKSFASFNPLLLGLGDISKDADSYQALAAMFDLEGFTDFANQIDPHLVIPEYLSSFLHWLFDSISAEVRSGEKDEKVFLWCPLPFFAKFMGDGVLLLWDTTSLTPIHLGNLVTSLRNICVNYQLEFLPQIRKVVSKPPSRLRCGIARGQVVSIGNGNDFVGGCINVAARVQKLGQFSFAFSKRGFTLEKNFPGTSDEKFQLIETAIRGVGEKELVYVLKEEFGKVPDPEKPSILP